MGSHVNKSFGLDPRGRLQLFRITQAVPQKEVAQAMHLIRGLKESSPPCRKALKCLIVLLTLSSMLAPPILGQQLAPPQAPLRIEDAIAAPILLSGTPIAVSPEGGWVAYTVQGARKRESMKKDERYAVYTPTGALAWIGGCDVWITNTKTGESRNLTQSQGTSWAPVWSPDGMHLAFYSDRTGLAHLWAWDISTGKARQLSDAIVRPFNFQFVRWTLDSRKILVRVLPQGMTVEQAADLISESGHKDDAQKQSPNGPTVSVYRSATATPAQQSPASGDSKRVEEGRWLNRHLADLALVDVVSGNIDRLVKEVRPIGYWISPNGKYVAYTHMKGLEANTEQEVYELAVVDIGAKSTISLVPDIEQTNGMSVSWSPNSHYLAYTTAGPRAKGDCFLISIAGGPPQILTEGAHPSFGDYFRAPLWDANGDYVYLLGSDDHGEHGTGIIWKASIRDHSFSVAAKIPDRVILEVFGPVTGGQAWSPDGGDSLILRTRDESTKQVGFYKVSLSKGASNKLFETSSHFGSQMIFGQDVSRDGKTVAYVEEDSRHPEDIWIANSDFTSRHPITNINPEVKDVTFGMSRVIDWRSIDGAVLHGALLLPADYREGKKYPLVVNVYGGSYGSDSVYRFGLNDAGFGNFQLLATRGYAVLLPDTPLHEGTPMLDMLKTVGSGVDRVVELGIADPNRVGVMGHSFGGYSALALIVQTNRFKAAVDIAGIGDLIGLYGEMDTIGSSWGISWLETGQGRMMGTPWQFRERYIENSPLFYLDRVETPLLIIHGELDRAVPYRQAEQVFVGLRRLGKEVEYARYEGEGHVPVVWKYANQVDFCNRVIAWFDEHLKSEKTSHRHVPVGAEIP